MAPASVTHGIIQATLAYLVTRRLIEMQSPCRAITEPAVVPRLQANTNLRVPDLGVTCSPNEPGQLVVPDPVLLVEILSPGCPQGDARGVNEADTRENVWAYASIPSVREILIVHSTRIAAELLRRQSDGSWPKEPEDIGPSGTLRLESIDLTCPLTDLYARTHLA